MINSKLVYSHICSKNLTQSSIERMYCIMEQNYSSISFPSFKNDLKNKQFIGLLKDIDNQIQVFENKGNRQFADISSTFVDRSRESELPALPSTGLLQPSYYQLVDLDGDGDLDVVRSHVGFNYSGSGMTIEENLGDGKFKQVFYSEFF